MTQREQCRNALLDTLKSQKASEKLPADELEVIARQIERSCFNYTIDECNHQGKPKNWYSASFVQRYSFQCARMIGYLNNENLLTKIINGNFSDLNAIANVPSHELCPEAYSDTIDTLTQRFKQKIDNKYSKDKCRNCGAQKVLRVQVQTRAADEIASFHFKCDDCGATWG